MNKTNKFDNIMMEYNIMKHDWLEKRGLYFSRNLVFNFMLEKLLKFCTALSAL